MHKKILRANTPEELHQELLDRLEAVKWFAEETQSHMREFGPNPRAFALYQLSYEMFEKVLSEIPVEDLRMLTSRYKEEKALKEFTREVAFN